MISSRMMNFLNERYPTPRSYRHPMSVREHWQWGKDWRRVEQVRRGYITKQTLRPVAFVLRMTNGRAWVDFK